MTTENKTDGKTSRSLTQLLDDYPLVTVTNHGNPSNTQICFNGEKLEVTEIHWKVSPDEIPLITLSFYGRLEVLKSETTEKTLLKMCEKVCEEIGDSYRDTAKGFADQGKPGLAERCMEKSRTAAECFDDIRNLINKMME